MDYREIENLMNQTDSDLHNLLLVNEVSEVIRERVRLRLVELHLRLNELFYQNTENRRSDSKINNIINLNTADFQTNKK